MYWLLLLVILLKFKHAGTCRTTSIARMQNKSAALSNRCCGGTSCFRLTKLWSWRHKTVMVCVFFEVFPKQLLANVWLSSVLDIVEDPSLVSASTTPFESSAGRSTSGMGQGPFVMDCGALEDVLRGARAGAILLKFFFFHFPVSQCLQFSDRCRHMCPTCARKLGPLMMLLIRRKTVYERLAEWNVKRCASNNDVVLCKFSIHQHCKLIMKKLKKFQRYKKKKEIKRNVEDLFQLRKKLIRIVHGCRYSVASDKWAPADCSTVLISMRAVIESAKFEKKKSRKRYKAARQKSKKKVLLQLRNKLIRSVHSCRCSVASH